MPLHHQPDDTESRTPLPVSPLPHTDSAPLRQNLDAEAEASRLPEPRAVRDLLAIVEQQNAQRRRLAFLALAFVVPVALILAFPGSSLSLLAYVFCCCLTAVMCGSFAFRYRRTTQALAQVDDVRMVGPLIERLHTG